MCIHRNTYHDIATQIAGALDQSHFFELVYDGRIFGRGKVVGFTIGFDICRASHC